MKKSLLSAWIFASILPVSAAVTATWTGAADNYWTNAANWLVEGVVPSACPGVVSNEVGGVFSPDRPSLDRAVFDGTCTSGRTTINLEGLYSISYVTVTGANAPKYTFGTDPATQFLPFETNGAFTVDASVPVANCPLVNAAVVTPANVDSADFWGLSADGKNPAKRDGGTMITINNNGAGMLIFNGDFVGPWFRPDALNTGYMEVKVAVNSASDGTLRFNGKQTHGTYLYSYSWRVRGRMEFYKDWIAMKQVTLTYAHDIYLGPDASFGPYVGNNAGFVMNDNNTRRVLGEGTLRFTENVGGSSFSNHGPNDFGRGRFEVKTKVKVDAAATARILLKTARTEGGRLVLESPEACDLKGGLYMTGLAILEVSSTNQLARCPVVTVDARSPTVKPHTDFMYATNTVVWAGSSPESFTTPVQFWGDAPRRFGLRNEGSAALTAGMAVTVDGESGNVSLRLDGATAPILYGATLGTAMPVDVVGDVTLTNGVDLTNVSGFMLKDGNLRFENEATFSPPLITVASGSNTITVAGTDVSINLARTAGSLDIARSSDATAVCSSLAGESPDWLTVDGRPASVDANGRVLLRPIATDVEIAARGDTVPNDAEQVVGIATDGAGGNDVLSADETAVKGLVQKATTPATVAIGASQTLTAETVVLADGAAALTVGDVAGQGTLAAAADGLSLRNQSFAQPLTVNAKLAGGAKPVDVSGVSPVVLAGGTASGTDLNVHNGTLKLTGTDAFPLHGLMVATNVDDSVSTLLLDGAREVTLPASSTAFAGLVGGYATLDGRGGYARIVIKNASLRSSAPAVGESYTLANYTNNTLLVGHYGSGIIEVLDGGELEHRLMLGGPASDDKHYGAGAVYQRGGRVTLLGLTSNNYKGASYLGGYNVNAGYYEQHAGEFLARGCFALGVIGTCGVFHQFGGLFCLSNHLTSADGSTGTGNLLLGASNSSMGHYYVRNGRADLNGNLIFNQSFAGNAQSAVTVSGDAAFVDNHANTVLANANAPDQNVVQATVNLVDGGCLRASGFRNNSTYSATFTDPSNHFFHVWFDRGTFETGSSNVDIATPGANYTDLHKYGINSFLVGPGGATVDTAGKTGNYSRKPFAAPTNGVVTAISGFTPHLAPTIMKVKMVGAPYIYITGDGIGARAEALFDSRTRMVTNVVVTSGGTGYTWARADFRYWGGYAGAYQTLDCVVSAPVSGSFTKAGAGDFTFQAANTYGGETVLKGGTLRLAAEGSLPEGTVVAYEGGALESAGEVFPASLKVRIPGAETGMARGCTLATFTNSLPASLPSVEVVNAPAAEQAYWQASFRGLTLRAVRVRGMVINFR